MDNAIREAEPLIRAVEVIDTDVKTEAAKRLYASLEPMALAGMGAQLLVALVNMGASVEGLGKIAGYRLKFLGGPIVCHSRCRVLESHPVTSNEAFKLNVRADRLKWALGLTELPVGPTEIAMVMYEASLQAPLTDHMAELYIWATKTAMYRVNPENLERLNAVPSKFSADGDPEQILADPMTRLTYFGFANEIQRKVINATQ